MSALLDSNVRAVRRLLKQSDPLMRLQKTLEAVDRLDEDERGVLAQELGIALESDEDEYVLTVTLAEDLMTLARGTGVPVLDLDNRLLDLTERLLDPMSDGQIASTSG